MQTPNSTNSRNSQILEKCKILKTPKNSNNYFQNLENSKINPTDFHTILPKTHQNYGSLFFKILKTSKNWKIIFKNFSKISENLENSKINPDKFHTKWPKIG